MIAVWALADSKELNDKPYPVYTAKKEKINNDGELDRWFETWFEKHSIIYYNDFSLVGRWSYIFDTQIDEWIMRYNLLKSNIHSYTTILDDLPAIWVEVLNTIETNLKLASNYGKQKS